MIAITDAASGFYSASTISKHPPKPPCPQPANTVVSILHFTATIFFILLGVPAKPLVFPSHHILVLGIGKLKKLKNARIVVAIAQMLGSFFNNIRQLASFTAL